MATLAACDAVSSPEVPSRSLGNASFSAGAPGEPAAAERPFGAELVWNTDSIVFAVPGDLHAQSLFGGRCSVLSRFMEFGHFRGEMMHAGLTTGTGSQCVQGTPTTGLTVTDAIDIFTAANGDILTLTWAAPITLSNGLFIVDGSFNVTGGSGRFEGASGGGRVYGVAHATPQQVLAGAPVEAEFTGTITYAAGRGVAP
ncbi:MAG TPA: hypothetical protein VLN49_10490 [Gemmatimonadaceae bacterium]|nr:hypothetical protein [Gemmatimonadaceae bacterium]